MSLILSLTQEAAAALQANPYFSSVDVLALNEKDIQSRIDDALIKRTGVAVVLGTSKLGQPSADVQGGGMLYFNDIVFHATVFENVPVNRATSGSGKFAPDVAETADRRSARGEHLAERPRSNILARRRSGRTECK